MRELEQFCGVLGVLCLTRRDDEEVIRQMGGRQKPLAPEVSMLRSTHYLHIFTALSADFNAIDNINDRTDFGSN